MSKYLAVAILLTSTSAFAQDKSADPEGLQGCPPIGQTLKGELIYSMDCKAIKTDFPIGEYKPDPGNQYEKYGRSQIGRGADGCDNTDEVRGN